MQLVERHIIHPNHAHYEEIDQAAFASKNLYNLANYTIRQHFFNTGEVYRYEDLYNILKGTEAYEALPRKVSQQVLRGLDKNWKSFAAAKVAWKKDPSRFLGRPKLPKYKHIENGRNILTYTIQAVSAKLLKIGQIKLSGLKMMFKTKQTDIAQVRIVPKSTHYVIEVVYNIEPKQHVYSDRVAGIDIGLDNLAVVTSNETGFKPVVINGKPLKSINQFYNKRKAELQSRLGNHRRTSKRLERLTDKRNRRIDHYMHVASRRIIDSLVEHNIGTLIIGKNDGWKQDINLGKRTNQNFVQIPHARFISMLEYKAKLENMKVVVTEESYTSKTSFLDGEQPIKHESYAGKRVKRGLFRSSTGRTINADLNGAYQIIKKVVSDAFSSEEIEGVVVHPLPIAGIN